MTPAADGVADRVDEVAQRGWDGLQPLLDQRIIDISGLSLTVGGVAAAVIAVLLALGISILVRRGLDRYGRRENVNRPALYTVSRLVHYTLLALGVMFALELAGVPISRFAVFAGAIGLGLGFGLQAIFSNFISGLILLFDKSLKVGDFIELEDDVRGTVRDINIRATRITTND
ncbi:MAG: mechanosensitive ion channel, partial [Lysobacter spongiicola]|nr:mechanosensitive ion channel [Lysobacter spongiicola]